MKEEPIESIEYKDYQINVYRDTDGENPRDNCDYTSHFWNNTYRYTFDRSRESKFGDILDDNDRLSKDFIKDHIFVKVYLYSHGGETVSTTPFCDRWDSGLFGILAESKESVREEFGVKRISPKLRKKIVDRLTAEVNEFDQWLTGEVYGYTVTPVDDTDNDLYSCWGFFGDYNDRNESCLMEDAMSEIDWLVKEDNERAERERQERERVSCEFWSGANAA